MTQDLLPDRRAAMMSTEKQKITLTCEVDSYRSGWTIVHFLSHRFKYHPPERWTQRVNDGRVQVNGSDVSTDHIVKKGDAVTYTILHTEPEVDFRYDVIYEDDCVLAISKSGNIPAHACGVYIRNTLIATLKNIYGDNLNLAHRLDRETSGLTLLSKDPQTARALGRMFARGDVRKLYAAVVHGRVRESSFEVDAPIGKTIEEITDRSFAEIDSDLVEDRPRYVARRRVDFAHGKRSVTRFEVERYVGGCTLLRAIPLSGRTNQIRVHLDYIGHPIVGDKVYKPQDVKPSVSEPRGLERRVPDPPACESPTAEPPAPESQGPQKAHTLINRHALHCSELRFNHPATGYDLRLVAPYPDDFVRLLEALAAENMTL